MRQVRRENKESARVGFHPPRLRVVWVEVFCGRLELLIPITVEIDLVRFFVGLGVKDARDKRVRVSVFVVELTRLGVIAPGLRDAERSLVLGGVDSLEVVSNRLLDKVLDPFKFWVLQDRVIDASGVAHVIALFLVLNKRNFCLGEVTPEVEHTQCSRK